MHTVSEDEKRPGTCPQADTHLWHVLPAAQMDTVGQLLSSAAAEPGEPTLGGATRAVVPTHAGPPMAVESWLLMHVHCTGVCAVL